MAQILKQSTAVDVLIGPFVDLTDGATSETGESPTVKLSKNGQALAAKNDATTPVSDADGYYNCEFDATDTNTVGTMVLIVAATASALPVRHEFQVIEEGVYDGLYGSGASDIADILVDTSTTLDTKLNDVQGATFSSSTDSLEALRNRGDSAWTGGATTSDSGTAQAGSSTTMTLESGHSAINDTYNGQLIFINAGTGIGQSRGIDTYVGSTGVATIIGSWATAPDATSVYEIFPDDIDEITAAPTVGAISDAVWDEPTTGHTNSGSFGEQCKVDIDAILSDTAELQTDWANAGRLDAILDTILVDTGTTLDGKINTIDGIVDNILLDTAELGAAVGASISADIAAVKVDTAAVLVDTGTTIPATITTIDSNVDAILLDTGTDGVVLASGAVVDATKIGGSSTAVTALKNSMAGIVSGAASGSPTTTVIPSDLTGYANDELIGRTIVFTGGTANGQASDITDYASSGGNVTVTALATAPVSGDTFVIV